MSFKSILSVTFIFALIHIEVSNAEPIGVNGIEIKVIPDTNLLTGITYRIDFPDHSYGILIGSEAKTQDNTGRYVQVEDHVERVKDYAQGGKWFKDTLWNLRGSEVSGYYTIENFNLPDHTLGVTVPKESPQGQPLYPNATYLVMLSKTAETTVDRELTLWKVVPGLYQDQYMLVNKLIPGIFVETARYGDFHKLVTIAAYSNNCRASQSYLKFKAVSGV